MSKQHKKLIRKQFRDSVFERDDYKCAFCEETEDLDSHHITDRTLMPSGGYVLENGISLCQAHHKLAEQFHETGDSFLGMSPDDLYKKIGSSYEKARMASEKLVN